MKRLISIILIMAITLTAMPIMPVTAEGSESVPTETYTDISEEELAEDFEDIPEETAEFPTMGSDDAMVNFTIFDALNILKHIIGMQQLTAAQITLYDYRGDKTIDVFNALEILKWLVWMPNSFGVNPNPQAAAAPRDLKAVSTNRQVTLTWSAPQSFGNRTFSHYEVSRDGGTSWINIGGKTSYNFIGLPNGLQHTFKVRAVTGAGGGAAATIIAAAGTLPSAPRDFKAKPGDGNVSLSWTVPADNGGAAIKRYEASSNDGATWISVTGTSHTFNGLTNGKTYTFAVRAVNDIGAGTIARATAVPKGGGGTNPSDLTQLAEEVVRLTNIERGKAGLLPLWGGDELMNAAAMQRAREITTHFYHDRPDGRSCWSVFDDFGIARWGAAENIAMGYATPADVVNGWMNSPGHYANIMNSTLTHIGVGAARGGDGHLYWVQLFKN